MRKIKFSYQKLKIALLFGAILFSCQLYSQDKKSKSIKIIHADFFEKDAKVSDAQKLIGNVEFEHEGVKMYCDSAYLFSESNSLDAYSRVQINQGDTINVFADTLYFDGNTKLAKFRGNVRMRDRDYKLDTDSMNYDVDKSVGIYRNFGTITSVKDKNVLTSIIGRYEASQKKMFFKDSVVLTHPDYVFNSDTLEYETQTEVAYFFGPTTITSDSSFIYCEKGMYDTRNEIAQLVKSAYVLTKEQTLLADSIYYERENGIGEGFGCVMLIDTTQKIHYTGEYAYRNENTNEALMYDQALLRQYEGEDTLYIHADTIQMLKVTEKVTQRVRILPDSLLNKSDSTTHLTDSTDIENNLNTLNHLSSIDSLQNAKTVKYIEKDTLMELSTIKAHYGVKWLREDMRGVCDSLYYTERDSLLKMFKKPAVWNDSSQITGDTIYVKNYEGKTESFQVYNNAFILQIADSTRSYYHQIKGRNLYGELDSNEIKRVLVVGNSEVIYFPEDSEPQENKKHKFVQISSDSLNKDTLNIQKDTLNSNHKTEDSLQMDQDSLSIVEDSLTFQEDTLSIQSDSEPLKKFSGMNYIKCSEMIMVMENKEVSTITFVKQPDGVVHPMDQLAGVNQKLKGFQLRFDERPNSPNEMIKREEVLQLDGVNSKEDLQLNDEVNENPTEKE